MKGKKLWAIVLTICLIVSSIGVISVYAEDDVDVVMSVSVDKSQVKANDEIEVCINLDRFQSQYTNDKKPKITSVQFLVTYDTSLFEYVDGSLEGGLMTASDYFDDLDYDLDGNGKISDDERFSESEASVLDGEIRAVAQYTSTSTLFSESTESRTIIKLKLKVKSDIKVTEDSPIAIQSYILRNLSYKEDYRAQLVNSAVKVTAPPVITVNNNSTVDNTYTTKVTVSATENADLKINGKSVTNPCTVSASGEYEVVATSFGGEDTEKFSINPVVSTIEVKTKPAKTEFVKGSALDLTGGVLKVTMSNEETKDVPMTDAAVTVEGYDSSTSGNQTVTIKYEGKSTTLSVNVIDKIVTNVVWNTMPAETIIEGQDLSVALQNAKVDVTYNDSSEDTLDVTAAMCENFDSTQVGTQTVTVRLGDKTVIFDITVTAKEVTKVEVENTPSNGNVYVEGTSLDLTGGTLKVTYNNGNSKIISMSEASVTGFDKNTVGTRTLTLSYGGKSTSMNVTVEKKKLSEIVVTEPTNTTVLEGKSLDVTGGSLLVKYNNGTQQIIPMSSDMVGTYDNMTPGQQDVTISYTEDGITKNATIKITVIAKEVESVELVSEPTNTTVLEGKELDLTGAKIKVNYNNDTDEILPVEKEWVKGFNNAQVGTQTVTVEYKGVQADSGFVVTVKAKSVTEVKITENNVTEVKEGKAFAPSGKITVSYDNGTSDIVSFPSESAVVDATAVDTNTPGEYNVNITYTDIRGNEHPLSYKVNVMEKELTRISVAQAPGESVLEGKDIDLTNGRITLYYDNDTTDSIAMTDAAVVLSGFDKNKVGTQTVTVTYNGKETSFAIEVVAKSVSRVELVSNPTATKVLEATEYDLTGGKIHVFYNNDTDEEIDMTKEMLTLDTTQVGEQEAKITYAGQEVSTFTVTVIAKEVEGIVSNVETSIKIVQGKDILASGLEIYVTYNNGTKVKVDLNDVTFTGFDSSKVGEQTVSASYMVDGVAYTTEFKVNVTEPETEKESESESQSVKTEENNKTDKDSSVKTGDSAQIILFLSAIAAAGAGFVVVARRKEQV